MKPIKIAIVLLILLNSISCRASTMNSTEEFVMTRDLIDVVNLPNESEISSLKKYELVFSVYAESRNPKVSNLARRILGSILADTANGSVRLISENAAFYIMKTASIVADPKNQGTSDTIIFNITNLEKKELLEKINEKLKAKNFYDDDLRQSLEFLATFLKCTTHKELLVLEG